MTKNEYLFICIAEECNELAHIISKSLRFGLDDIEPNQNLTNRERVILEIKDLVSLIEYSQLDINLLQYEFNRKPKIDRFERYLNYSVELGIVKND